MEAATRREVVNRLYKFLSCSKLFGVEFTNINKRNISSGRMSGWVDYELEQILSW